LSRRFAGRDQVAIVGYGQTAIARHAEKSLGALTLEASRSAIADAGLSVTDIDGFVTAPLFPSLGSHGVADGVSIVSSPWLAQHLGLNPRYAVGIQGAGQLPGSVALAADAVHSGAVNYVLVHRALHNPPRGRYHERDARQASGSEQWTLPQGYFGPIASIALPYTEYMQRYGCTRETTAKVVTESRKNGARIPWSYWYERPLRVEDYLTEPLIQDPVCRLDCDIPVDGVAAFIITSADRARDLPHRPVYVSGYAVSTPARRRLAGHWPLEDIMEVGSETGRRLWQAAGIGPSDVDLPQVYDGFAPLVYFWLETLGFCPVGEAHRLIDSGGIESDDPAALPVLSGGGALGNGRMHGTPQMLECYLQLSGRAGPRQRIGVEVAVACQGIPHVGGAVVYRAG
jgi:acetyl-CoA acetyltransferase